MTPLFQRTAFTMVAILASLYAVLAVRGPNGMPALMEKRRQISALQEENAILAAENQRRVDRIQKLESDRSVQELEIRKRLKLLHPGETQFIIPDQKPEP